MLLGPTPVNPSWELQIVPSALPESSPLASTSPSPPKTNKIQPCDLPSTTADTRGFNFASNLSQLRSPRVQERQILFHAPLESPSPSRSTRRSLSDPSISILQPDLSELQIAPPTAEPGTLGSQERQAPCTTETQLQQWAPAELPEQSQPSSPPNFPWKQAVPQPEFVLEPAGADPKVSSTNFGGLDKSYDVFLPDADRSDMVNLNGQSNGDSHVSETLEVNTDSTEIQAETQNGHDEQRLHHVQGCGDGNQPNGHVPGSRGSFNSSTLDYWPLPADPEEHAVPTVSEQLSRLFITGEWSDWSIEISSPVANRDSVSYLAHGILMARSPVLRREMHRKIFSHRMERVIVISPDWYIQPQAFEAVVRYLYTESLLTMQEVKQMSCIGAPEEGLPTQAYLHSVVLSYWMTGLILKLPLIVDRAVQLIQETLDWDVLELAFQQALILEESASSPSVDLPITQPNTPGSSGAVTASASSLRNISRSSFRPSDHSLPATYLSATRSYRYPDINAMMSTEIKKLVYQFISQRVDMSTFETDVPSTTGILRSYLPNIHEYSNTSRYNFNPALASIRFGDMPPAENETPPATAQWEIPRSTAKVTSAILLNLNYADLREFCLVLKATTELSNDKLCEWIRTLVEEREKRRRKVLSSKTVSNSQRLSQKQVWNVVGWEEYLHITDDPAAQWEIRQKWTGFTLPTRQ